jgi:hypothetical protein
LEKGLRVTNGELRESANALELAAITVRSYLDIGSERPEPPAQESSEANKQD